MANIHRVAILLLACLGHALSYKILVMVPMPARSHHNLGKGVADILHQRGHEITLVSCYPSEKPVYREIGVPELLSFKDDSRVNFDMGKGSKLGLILKLNTWIPQMVEEALKSKNMHKLLHDKTEKFDLVIIEYFINDAYAGLGVKFNCPVVMVSPVTLMHFLARSTGNPIAPESVPNVFLSYTEGMSLLERAANTGMAVILEIMNRFFLAPTQKEIYVKYFPEEAAKVPFEDLKKLIGATLVNSHPSIGIARPLLPNTVEVGGYHIGDVKPLPEDLQKTLDSAKHGVIYFSMGSNLKSSAFPVSIRKDILNALAKLKQIVIWKFETDLPDKPSNVIIKSWLPQTSILAHPNVKIFISHGGLLSCTEAASAGVPLLAIPIFGDQHFNAKATQRRGNGLQLDYTNVTEASLTWALNEMLQNPSYERTAKTVYRLFHDRPMSPRDLISFYAEHVVRTGGAGHLAPPELSLCSTLLLDVAALLLLPPTLLLLGIVCLCKRCCSKKRDPQTKPQPKLKQKKN